MSGAISVIVGVLIVFGVFFAIRNALIWYFRIDEALDELKKTNAALLKLIELQSKQ